MHIPENLVSDDRITSSDNFVYIRCKPFQVRCTCNEHNNSRWIASHLVWTLVEDLIFIPSLHALQGHVLTEASVDAEGQGQALLEPQPLLEATGRRVDVQQVLGAVVVRQGHASHQAWNNQLLPVMDTE